MNVLAELRSRFRCALADLEEDTEQYAEMVLPSQDAKFGDYQANCAMPLGKKLGKPPRDIAQSWSTSSTSMISANLRRSPVRGLSICD